MKVCGMTQLQQVAQLAALGVDYAGFIFYPASPRYVAGKIEPAALKALAGIKKVGVFVNATVETIRETVAAYGLEAVQLHGEETPEFIRSLNINAKIIKVFRLKGDEDIAGLTDPFEKEAAAFLFDTKAKEYGGTGQKFDWSALRSAVLGKSWFLSGGIGPKDITDLKSFLADQEVYALDVNSRFETAPGIKDMGLIEKFIKGLKGE
ncbi:N-(5'-phosphoribosyl)anthranilate isomerase [Niabella soli DSM 19437]|uniref:N-(5'-phosphoribosyl)anthranilate isomerase n=2 Tax=Niabella TaxID=379899 RepID=W0F0Z7_9BACT|nr:N-(5'-phosphoribosyl)anthranilate isomerase [Niabella soli DSM 19437]